MICSRCKKEFKLIRTSKQDGLCGKCRSRQKYLDNVDKYRKTKGCPGCGKKILKISNFCYSCTQTGSRNRLYTDGHSSKGRTCCECNNIISSGSKKGRCFSCYSKTLKGKGNPNYRFGHYSGDFTSRSEYKEWRLAIYRRDKFMCRICGKQHTLEAHHIYPKRDYPELVFDTNNGITLCKEHHEETYSKEYDFIIKFQSIIMAEVKIRELGEPCNGNT